MNQSKLHVVMQIAIGGEIHTASLKDLDGKELDQVNAHMLIPWEELNTRSPQELSSLYFAPAIAVLVNSLRAKAKQGSIFP